MNFVELREGEVRRIHLPRRQAMYACIPEIERGFFQGVCAPSNASANFRDPLHLFSIRELIRGSLHISAGHSGGW